MPDCVPARLEPATIRRLAEDIESPTMALNFLRDFLSMLPGRITRILNTLAEPDAKGAMDATLSLRIASAMTGALDVETCCRGIESLIRSGQFEEASETAQHLRGIVTALMAAGPDLLREAQADLDGQDLHLRLNQERRSLRS
ncbi:Hpt domain-containing protein [Arthrobacter sp. B6]|uniref:Hpt domain-containing protein n=1 Tax=Arthrobacter sp. B6 TaxID=1570137 RepID=UPI00082AC10F|nr:Hpt domain-containing protein [Arthrobacter sp. B6]